MNFGEFLRYGIVDEPTANFVSEMLGIGLFGIKPVKSNLFSEWELFYF